MDDWQTSSKSSAMTDWPTCVLKNPDHHWVANCLFIAMFSCHYFVTNMLMIMVIIIIQILIIIRVLVENCLFFACFPLLCNKDDHDSGDHHHLNPDHHPCIGGKLLVLCHYFVTKMHARNGSRHLLSLPPLETSSSLSLKYLDVSLGTCSTHPTGLWPAFSRRTYHLGWIVG